MADAKNKYIIIRVAEDDRKALQKIARKKDITLSECVRELVLKYIENYGKKKKEEKEERPE
jgi:hypothetical protein